jgi:hypothetical protein
LLLALRAGSANKAPQVSTLAFPAIQCIEIVSITWLRRPEWLGDNLV